MSDVQTRQPAYRLEVVPVGPLEAFHTQDLHAYMGTFIILNHKIINDLLWVPCLAKALEKRGTKG